MEAKTGIGINDASVLLAKFITLTREKTNVFNIMINL